MRYSNLHTHTTFSDGKHSLEANIVSAIEKQMLSLGFSDHSFTGPDTSYCMQKERYLDYCREIGELKIKYADKLPVYCGLELDYFSAVDYIPVKAKSLGPDHLETAHVKTEFDPFVPEELNAFDYLIASVHYIVKDGICYPIDHSPEQQLDCIQTAFGGDLFAMIQCYFDMLCEHVERVRPTVVGHFDVLAKFSLMPEDDPRYQEIAGNALKRILKTCPYIEVNTGAIARGWRTAPYPNEFLLRLLLELGGKPVLGSDSHHKDNLIFYFDETVELLKSIGFKHIYAFNGNGFDPFDIG